MTVKVVDGPGKRQFEIMLKNLSGKVGKVGWLDGSKYPNDEFVAQVAAIQEYGAPSKNIPPRSFIRPTIAKKSNEWQEIARKGAIAFGKGTATLDQVFEAIGLKAAADIQKAITEVFSPALAERTILARIARHSTLSKAQGRLSYDQLGAITKPLIDTGLMLATLTHSVEPE